MKSALIRHPENDPIMIRRGWQVQAINALPELNGVRTYVPQVGAELLTIFEHFHTNRLDNRILRREFERMIRKRPNSVYPVGDWIPYTAPYLMELLLGGHARKLIAEAIQILERLGFISTQVPGDIPKLFSIPYTWIRLDVDAINIWIDAHVEKSWVYDWIPPEPEWVDVQNPETGITVSEPEPFNDTPVTKAQMRGMQVNSILKFHQHIMGKQDNYIYKGKRKSCVENRIKEGRTLGQCAQMIIGCRLSPWHNGTDPGNVKKTVYDDPTVIFRDVVKADMFIGHAEEGGVTEGKALIELETFLKGGTSRYAKRPPKPLPIASNGQMEYVPQLTEEERKRYRDFARAMGAFFVTNEPVSRLIEFTKTNASMQKFNKARITDLIALEKALIDAVKVFRPNGVSESIQQNIEKFAKVYVQIQQANS